MGDGDRATLRARWPGPDHVRRRRASNRRPEAIRRRRRVQPTTGGTNTLHARDYQICWVVVKRTHAAWRHSVDPGLSTPPICRRNRVCAPHRAVVELRAVVEAEHRVPLLELRGVAEEADDLAVLVRVRGHSVPGLWREVRGALFDERV